MRAPAHQFITVRHDGTDSAHSAVRWTAIEATACGPGSASSDASWLPDRSRRTSAEQTQGG
jgi:hypothetical protein